ncbi:hypothetical protein, partial [Candidatus Magnetobacterium casense]
MIIHKTFTNNYGKYKLAIYHDRTVTRYKTALIFSGGYFTWLQLYNWVGESFASRDCVVGLFTPPDVMGKDVRQWADGFWDAVNCLANDFNISRFIFAGHSMGAAGATIAGRDLYRTDAVVALAPPWPPDDFPDQEQLELIRSSVPNINCPLSILVGELDKVTGYEASLNHFEQPSDF